MTGTRTRTATGAILDSILSLIPDSIPGLIPGSSPRSIFGWIPGLILGIAGTTPSFAGWDPLNGPEPPMVSASTATGGVYLLGTSEDDAGDIYRSTDAGATWENVRFPNGGVTVLFPHASGVYAGIYLGSTYRSTDLGLTWEAVGNGLPPSLQTRAIAADGTTLLIAPGPFQAGRIYRSQDDGASWAELAGSPSFAWESILVSGSTIVTGSRLSGLHRSSDGGVTWSLAAGIPSSARVSALARDGAALYAGVEVPAQGVLVYRSTDDGAQWEVLSADLPSTLNLEIRQLLVHDGALFAAIGDLGADHGLYRSTDGGVHWQEISAGIPATDWVETVLADGPTLFAGTVEGLYRTTDNGATWAYSGHGTAGIRGTGSLLFHDDALLVGLQTSGGLGRGIYRTTDLGTTWTKGTGFPGVVTATDLIESDGALFASIYGALRGVARSTDGGLSWTPSSTGLPSGGIFNTLHAQDGVLLLGAHEGIFRSTNGGDSWSSVPGAADVYNFTSWNGAVYAGLYGNGVLRSTDGGQSWTPADGGLSGNERFVQEFAVWNGTLFAATNGGGVQRFDGSVWIPAGLDGQFVNALLSVDGALVAGSALFEKLLVSTDGGGSWIPIEEDYSGGEVYELASDGETLIAGSRGFGVWSRPLLELPTPTSAGEPRVDATPPDGRRSDRAVVQLGGIAPFPARTTAAVSYALREASPVVIELFDLSGRRVLTADQGFRPAGTHAARIHLAGVSAGLYAFVVQAGDARAAGRLLVVR